MRHGKFPLSGLRGNCRVSINALGDLETADEFFTFQPLKAIRTENDIACMAGAAGLAAALAVTMIKGPCAAFKLVAYGAAQATARER